MSPILLQEVKANREAWLEIRKRSLGSSDLARAVAWNQTCRVILEKQGRVPGTETTDAMAWGLKLEHVVAQACYEKLIADGLEVELIDTDALYVHPDHKFLTATPDYLIKVNGRLGILECKTANAHNLSQWEVGPSDYAQVQIYHQLECIPEAEFAIAACLILTPTFRHHFIDRNHDVQKALVTKARWMWNFVESNELPPVDSYDGDIVKALYPRSNGLEILLPEEALTFLEEYKVVSAQLKDLEDKKDVLGASLKAMLGEARTGRVGPHAIQWTQVHSSAFDKKAFEKDHPDLFAQYVHPSSYRTFKILGARNG